MPVPVKGFAQLQYITFEFWELSLKPADDTGKKGQLRRQQEDPYGE